jgi:transcriptional regulator NrdR family protein
MSEKPKCSFCGSDYSRVIDTRGSWRRRECDACNERFSTAEVVVRSSSPKHRAAVKQQPGLW